MDKPRKTAPDDRFVELESVDSTNNYAMARVHAGLAYSGQAYLARHQWAGKGQRGRTWLSEPGQNICMSLVLDPHPMPVSGQFLLGAAAALGCLNGVTPYAPEGWSLKWPNDLYWRDRKAAGILIENLVRGTVWSYAVIGVGMNLNQTAFPGLPQAVSLRQITGRTFDPFTLARELAGRIWEQTGLLQQRPDAILKNYNRFLYRRGQAITLRRGDETFETRIAGVSAEGLLIAEDGRQFAWGEVEFVTGS
jgi:BirA family biotin operon repressor/biotin-[acetyl-CoA-carboxylase] ligase